MPLKDALWQKATIQSSTTSYDGDEEYVTVATNIATRIEYTEKLVRDKLSHDIIANSLFFFLYSDVQAILPNYKIIFEGREYFVVRADLLSDKTGYHHWEVWAI